MKLIRFGQPENERPGVILEDGTRLDVSSFGGDFDEDFFARDGVGKLTDWVGKSKFDLPVIPSGERLGPPVCRPGKIVCIGLNFRDHAAETGAIPPTEPVLFTKATSALCGPNDDLILPRDSSKVDWEVEFAFVIGRRASCVTEEDALGHVAGYCMLNDFSERAFQKEHCGQWVKGKSCDTFAPLGPILATPDELADPEALRMWLKVNGETRQDGTTADMIFRVPVLVSYISRFMTLMPGDIVSTGTPAGVGMGMIPPAYLQPGDVIEWGVDGLGEAKRTARAWESA